MKISAHCLIISIITLFLTSCISSKQIVYFQDAKPTEGKTKDDTETDSATNVKYTVKIQPFDVLDIRVKVKDPKQGIDNFFLNNPLSGSGTSGIPTAYYAGFLVDRDGIVHLPLLGDLNLKNATIEEAREILRKKAQEYFHEPYVEVKFLTFKVTIMGEVNNPGTINIPNEKANLIDAISLAGDLSEFADSRRVKIIRGDVSKNPKVFLVNLTSIASLKSEGYNLKPNDLVYVEPLPRKFFLANTATVLSIVSVLNIFLILALRFTEK